MGRGLGPARSQRRIAWFSLAVLGFVALLAAMLYVSTMPAAKEKVIQWRAMEMEAGARQVRDVFAMLAEMEQDGLLSRTQAQRRALLFARAHRRGSRNLDYCWINDMQARVVMHPFRSDLEDQEPENLLPPGRVNPFQLAVERVNEQGGGMISYRWQRPQSSDPASEKTSFVTGFSPWGWVIGTGVFVQDLEDDFSDLARYTHNVSLVVLALMIILAGAVIHRFWFYERKHQDSKKSIRQHRERLRLLASQLSLAGERERRQIAVDLHDRIGQNLALAKINLGVCREHLPLPWKERVEQVRNLLAESIRETRSLTFEISPPLLYEISLAAALEELSEHFADRYGVEIEFYDDRSPKPLSLDLQVQLYQGGRELLVNAVKHAQAKHIRVDYQCDGATARLLVEDDGVGFNHREKDTNWTREGGFGLFSLKVRMGELGGSLQVDSAPGRGTRVEVFAPLETTVNEIDKNETYITCG